MRQSVITLNYLDILVSTPCKPLLIQQLAYSLSSGTGCTARSRPFEIQTTHHEEEKEEEQEDEEEEKEEEDEEERRTCAYLLACFIFVLRITIPSGFSIPRGIVGLVGWLVGCMDGWIGFRIDKLICTTGVNQGSPGWFGTD
ncbi:hypothetical protein M0802_003984 [Mischocyttarus mexicanus]|nr:hypothetical protein M0802_003984 [Mischocyttarus mexicanus]